MHERRASVILKTCFSITKDVDGRAVTDEGEANEFMATL